MNIVKHLVATVASIGKDALTLAVGSGGRSPPATSQRRALPAGSPPNMMNLLKISIVCGGIVACGPAGAPQPRAPQPRAEPTSTPTASPVAASPQPSCRAPEVDAPTQACLDGPRPTSCVVSLSRARIQKGEEQSAADALVQAIFHAPKERTPYLELALLLQTNNRYDIAAKVLSEAKRFVPEDKRFLVHYLLASTHAAELHMREGVLELEAAHALKPKDFDVTINLALSYTSLEPRRTADAKALLGPLITERCGDERFRSLCKLAKDTLERIAGNLPWPRARTPAVTLSPFPASPCVAPVDVDGKPTLPSVVLPSDPVRDDSMFTVWGASHHLRSTPHRKGVTTGPITVVGFVVATNYAKAPACAVHRSGKPDPADCVAPMPTFYLADKPSEPTSFITVMGWASQWSTVYEMMLAIDKQGGDAETLDAWSGKPVPNPIPSLGARVAVTGSYDFTFTTGTAAVSNPRFGVLSYQHMTVERPASTKATLPGISRR